ncbi:hypothetical protein INQ51_13135 [Maribellus sp. CM-23]|uniref:hypothetical protein n=1 Tax=Maribellus sp. CM-23 TaxID=2781026 RepID=UPI001F45E354|nr:hypothetical protein [Maribellus sp. CM-23]MCE4565254.1 hypothetical protein [Maribellus sp. CM-23]
MADLEKLLKELKDEGISLALNTVNEFKNEAKEDAVNLIDSLQTDIKSWTLMVLNGELSKGDLEWLVMAKKDLIEMVGLKNIGLAKIKIDELKNKLLGLIVNKIFSLV